MFLTAGGDLLTLSRGEPLTGGSGLHLGFMTESDEELARWRSRLIEKKIAIEDEHRDDAGWSVYFRDPDGYLIEILNLADRPGRTT